MLNSLFLLATDAQDVVNSNTFGARADSSYVRQPRQYGTALYYPTTLYKSFNPVHSATSISTYIPNHSAINSKARFDENVLSSQHYGNIFTNYNSYKDVVPASKLSAPKQYEVTQKPAYNNDSNVSEEESSEDPHESSTNDR